MTWLLKALRARELLLISLVGGLLAALLRGQQASVPSITGGGLAPVPLVAVLALFPAVAALRMLEGLPGPNAATAVRPVGTLWRVGVLVLLVVTATTTGLLVGTEAAFEFMRNASGLTGIALLSWRFVGRGNAIGLVLSYLVVSFLFGATGSSTDAALWAWILRSPDNAASQLVAGLLLLVGLVLLRPTFTSRGGPSDG